MPVFPLVADQVLALSQNHGESPHFMNALQSGVGAARITFGSRKSLLALRLLDESTPHDEI